MRHEPETRNHFQCEVSLNMSQGKMGILLVNEDSHEEFGAAQSRRDGGVRPGQPEGDFVPRRSSSYLWFCGGSAQGPAVPALEPGPTRRDPTVPDEGQRIEPGADGAADRRLDEGAAGAEAAPPTWSCWPKGTPLTRSYPGRLRVVFWNASSRSSASHSTKRYRIFRFLTSTTYAIARPIGGAGCVCGTRKAVRCPSPNGANPTRKGSPATCVWIRYIRVSTMASRGCIISTPSTR